MNRAERRRADAMNRRIQRVIERDGDHCSICRAPLQHNCKTYYGVTYGGEVACVAECCRSKLQTIKASGVFCSSDHPHEVPFSKGAKPPSSLEEIADAVGALQGYIAAADEMCSNIGRRAGMPKGTPYALHTFDSPWKDADRIWFDQHPDRSHRLRRIFPGELRGKEPPFVPAGHELQIIVRQVEPGKRMRLSFIRNLKVDIPDIEEILHAIFDIVSISHDKNIPIRVVEIGMLAEKYARAAGPV
jgi:hypothetical protein